MNVYVIEIGLHSSGSVVHVAATFEKAVEIVSNPNDDIREAGYGYGHNRPHVRTSEPEGYTGPGSEHFPRSWHGTIQYEVSESVREVFADYGMEAEPTWGEHYTITEHEVRQ